MSLYAITNNPENPTSGLYATMDDDGLTTVQLFENEDDAVCYNTLLEAIGQNLHVKEIVDHSNIDKLCDIMGYSFTIVQAGEVVVPRYETIATDLSKLLDDLT